MLDSDLRLILERIASNMGNEGTFGNRATITPSSLPEERNASPCYPCRISRKKCKAYDNSEDRRCGNCISRDLPAEECTIRADYRDLLLAYLFIEDIRNLILRHQYRNRERQFQTTIQNLNTSLPPLMSSSLSPLQQQFIPNHVYNTGINTQPTLHGAPNVTHCNHWNTGLYFNNNANPGVALNQSAGTPHRQDRGGYFTAHPHVFPRTQSFGQNDHTMYQRQQMRAHDASPSLRGNFTTTPGEPGPSTPNINQPRMQVGHQFQHYQDHGPNQFDRRLGQFL